jgi:hypothetical protein
MSSTELLRSALKSRTTICKFALEKLSSLHQEPPEARRAAGGVLRANSFSSSFKYRFRLPYCLKSFKVRFAKYNAQNGDALTVR